MGFPGLKGLTAPLTGGTAAPALERAKSSAGQTLQGARGDMAMALGGHGLSKAEGGRARTNSLPLPTGGSTGSGGKLAALGSMSGVMGSVQNGANKLAEHGLLAMGANALGKTAVGKELLGALAKPLEALSAAAPMITKAGPAGWAIGTTMGAVTHVVDKAASQ